MAASENYLFTLCVAKRVTNGKLDQLAWLRLLFEINHDKESGVFTMKGGLSEQNKQKESITKSTTLKKFEEVNLGKAPARLEKQLLDANRNIGPAIMVVGEMKSETEKEIKSILGIYFCDRDGKKVRYFTTAKVNGSIYALRERILGNCYFPPEPQDEKGKQILKDFLTPKTTQKPFEAAPQGVPTFFQGASSEAVVAKVNPVRDWAVDLRNKLLNQDYLVTLDNDNPQKNPIIIGEYQSNMLMYKYKHKQNEQRQTKYIPENIVRLISLLNEIAKRNSEEQDQDEPSLITNAEKVLFQGLMRHLLDERNVLRKCKVSELTANGVNYVQWHQQIEHFYSEITKEELPESLVEADRSIFSKIFGL